jgi:signal transduction histidine kinase
MKTKSSVSASSATVAAPSPADLADLAAAVLGPLAITQHHVFSTLLHELRGPLNNISMVVALCERFAAKQMPGEALPPRLQELLNALRGEVAQLEAAARDVSALVDPNTGTLENLDARELLEECAGIVRTSAMSQRVAIHTRRAREAVPLMANRRNVRCALVATLSYLIDDAQPGTIIEIGAQASQLGDTEYVACFFVTTADSDVTQVSPPSATAKLTVARQLVAALGGQFVSSPGIAPPGIEIRFPVVTGGG